MTVTANGAVSAIPAVDDSLYIYGNASGTGLVINPGDYVVFSGAYVIAATGLKQSGAGIAMDRNPAYDWAGRQVINSALLIATRGLFRVSASFSGQPLFGLVCQMAATGSAVNSPSGVTGVGATWNTGTPVSVSGGTAAAPVSGYAQVINWYNSGPAGTGQMDIRLWDRNADYY